MVGRKFTGSRGRADAAASPPREVGTVDHRRRLQDQLRVDRDDAPGPPSPQPASSCRIGHCLVRRTANVRELSARARAASRRTPRPPLLPEEHRGSPDAAHPRFRFMPSANAPSPSRHVVLLGLRGRARAYNLTRPRSRSLMLARCGGPGSTRPRAQLRHAAATRGGSTMTVDSQHSAPGTSRAARR